MSRKTASVEAPAGKPRAERHQECKDANYRELLQEQGAAVGVPRSWLAWSRLLAERKILAMRAENR